MTTRRPLTDRYTDSALDGLECARCGADLCEVEASEPWISVDGRQLFVCVACARRRRGPR